MSKRKLEETNIPSINVFSISTPKSKDATYIIKCANEEEAQSLKTNTAGIFFGNVKSSSVQDKYLILEFATNKSLFTHISAVTKKQINVNHSAFTYKEVETVLDAHFQSPNWRPKMFLTQIKNMWQEIANHRKTLLSRKQQEIRILAIEKILISANVIQNRLVELSSFYQKDQVTPLQVSEPQNGDIKGVAFIPFSEIEEKIEQLSSLILDAQNNTLSLRIIGELLKLIPRINKEYSQLKSVVKPNQTQNYLFFNPTKIPQIEDLNNSSFYSDQFINTFLTTLIRKSTNVFADNVFTVSFPLENNTRFRDRMIDAILRAKLNITTLFPVRINVSHKNYLIGILVKPNKHDIVIKFLDSYGSCFSYQSIYTPNKFESSTKLEPKECNFIIGDINSIDNIEYLNLPYKFSNVLLQFLDLLVKNVKPRLTFKNETKIKLIVPGIVQQTFDRPDSGPYVVFNLIAALYDSPYFKYPESALRAAQQKYLAQNFNTINNTFKG